MLPPHSQSASPSCHLRRFASRPTSASMLSDGFDLLPMHCATASSCQHVLAKLTTMVAFAAKQFSASGRTLGCVLPLPHFHLRCTGVHGHLSLQPSLNACHGMPHVMERLQDMWSCSSFTVTDTNACFSAQCAI